MVDTDTEESVTRTKSEEDVINIPSDIQENLTTIDEEDKHEEEELAKRKAEAKKGISITRALITFGFESWIALEPGTYKNRFRAYFFDFVIYFIMLGM